MAVFNLDFYKNEDGYSDGDIENALLSYVKGNLSWEQLLNREERYAVLYHLSPLRENILNWYSFAPEASVLEIGSGCGAITGLLCKKAARVVSVELSRRRASINFERHKDFPNLEIMAGNLNEMKFDCRFDYVILNGVLEYAMSFTEGDHPYETFLNNIRELLKPEGHLLIAIENRLGLKYFNGAPEDHTGHYFEGIDQYRDNDTVRTFSRAELSALLRDCGLSAQKFYYPYPDYKFPVEIFTDETIERYEYGKPFVNLDESRCLLFEEYHAWQAFSREEITKCFANSFLADVSPAPWEAPLEKQYVKLNNDRRNRFRIATSIELWEGERVVVKEPLTEEAGAHIDALMKNSHMTPEPRFQNISGTRLPDGGIRYPFLKGDSLEKEMKGLIEEGKADEIIRTLHQVFDTYGRNGTVSDQYHTEDFARVFGEEKLDVALSCVKPANIDLICDNIFRDGDGYQIIDCEWVFDMPVPTAFIIWRCINELYTKNRKLEKLIPRERMMLAFDIDQAMCRVFWEWATYFAKEYTGSSSLEAYTVPMTMLSLDQIVMERRSENTLCCSLYYDTGEGCSEEQKLYSEVKLQQERFSVTYDLRKLQQELAAQGKEIRQLRWDPLEGDACICRLDRITGMEAVPVNADAEEEGRQVFLTTDPIYRLEGEQIPKQITLEGTVHRFSAPELVDYISDRLPLLRWQSATMKEVLMKQQQEVERLEGLLEEKNAAHQQVCAEKEMLERQHTGLTEEFQNLKAEYDQAVGELEEIHASRSWRLLNRLKGK